MDKVLLSQTVHHYPQASPYPLILSLENHCSVEQQTVMAQHLRAILGEKLLVKPLSGLDSHYLPSPEVNNVKAGQKHSSTLDNRYSRISPLSVDTKNVFKWNMNCTCVQSYIHFHHSFGFLAVA